MRNKYETVVFAISQYKWGRTVEEARAEMWKDIAKTLEILLRNEYITVVRDDDTDIIVIEYGHDERFNAWGSANPVWLEEDEYYLKSDLEEDNTEEENY